MKKYPSMVYTVFMLPHHRAHLCTVALALGVLGCADQASDVALERLGTVGGRSPRAEGGASISWGGGGGADGGQVSLPIGGFGGSRGGQAFVSFGGSRGGQVSGSLGGSGPTISGGTAFGGSADSGGAAAGSPASGGREPQVPTGGSESSGGAVPDGGSTICSEDDFVLPNDAVVVPTGLDGCPDGMARVWAGFCMDRWECHLVEIANDGTELPWSPYITPGNVAVRAVSAPGAVPQGYITGIQAADACAAAGKRLCTNEEWVAACRGADDLQYPYGDTEVLGTCNDHRDLHPVVELFGTSESWIWSELFHPCISQQPNTLDPTGTREACVTEDGIYDLVGNLHEWTDDAEGTFRGGFYVDTRINGAGCDYRTVAHDRGHWDYSTGFRCCANP